MTQSTYQSFTDVELFEPDSPPRANTTPSMKPTTDNANRISRQDSGYESYASPRSSASPCRQPRNGHCKRTSVASSTRTRPRAPRSSTAKTVPAPQQLSARPSGYFHFPQHPSDITPPPQPAVPISPFEISDRAVTVSPPPCLPPQTTHYWTSDSTRRLEYAAIDASCRGVKGWIRRNLVPGCFGADEGRKHLAFDDDSGSVRRYRLELEEAEEETQEQEREKMHAGKRKGWLWRKMTV